MKKRISWSLCAIFCALAGCGSDAVESITCDETTRPEGICRCENLTWQCEEQTCPSQCEFGCEEDGTCKKKPAECPSECENSCNEDGTCSIPPESDNCKYGHNEDGSCLDKPVQCPPECENSCNKDGICDEPPESPDNCQYGHNEDGSCLNKPECPEECPDNCTDNVCNPPAVQCPENCPDDCDENGQCPVLECPEECPGNCTNNVCNPPAVQCPKECPDDCDEDGNCEKCPKECPDTCREDGTCPPKCPEKCPNTCLPDGTCPVECPKACPNRCDSKGVCPCPKTCTTSCNTDGVCQCPKACPNSCTSTGECPVMCGNETVTSMYFAFPETDLLPVGAKARQSVTVPLYIKTKESKTAYTITTAPCKNDIVLKSSNTKIMTATKGESSPTFKPVSTGTATGTATIGSQSLKASITVHVLDPDVMKESIALQESGKLKHLFFKTDLPRNRVTQGFDFYDYNKIFFSMGAVGGKIKGTTTEFDRRAVLVYEVSQATGKTAGEPTYIYDAGHGQGLSIEHASDNDYIWMGNYGSLDVNNPKEGYSSSQTLCRVPLVYGKSYKKADIEHYYLPDPDGVGYAGLEPGLDVKNNRFVFRGKKSGSTYIKIYKLSAVKALKADTTVKLARPLNTLDDALNLLTGIRPSIKVKDLSKVDPIHQFSMKSSEFLDQGFTFENGIVYAVGGVPSSLGTPDGKYKYKSNAKVKLFSQTGTLLYSYNLQPCDSNGFFKTSSLDALVNKKDSSGKLIEWNTGYFEPEGIRVKDGKVFVNMTVRVGHKDSAGKDAEQRRHYVFVYDLTRGK